jgi:hypothetical protein
MSAFFSAESHGFHPVDAKDVGMHARRCLILSCIFFSLVQGSLIRLVFFQSTIAHLLYPKYELLFLIFKTSISSCVVQAQKRDKLCKTILSSFPSSLIKLFGNIHHSSIFYVAQDKPLACFICIICSSDKSTFSII